MRKLSMQELGRLSTEEFKKRKKIPVVVILDDVRSGLNVGSVFRTSDAFCIQEIHLCGYSPKPPHREVLKSALGATETVSWKSFDQVSESVWSLKNDGYTVYAVEQVDTAVSLNNLELVKDEPIAFIFGNEVSGVSDEALALADVGLEIPQWGTKHSLNISICAGIVLWEVTKVYQT